MHYNIEHLSFDFNFQHPLASLVEVVHKGGGWDERDRRLILWHFEELLKQRYKEYVGIVEVRCAWTYKVKCKVKCLITIISQFHANYAG